MNSAVWFSCTFQSRVSLQYPLPQFENARIPAQAQQLASASQAATLFADAVASARARHLGACERNRDEVQRAQR